MAAAGGGGVAVGDGAAAGGGGVPISSAVGGGAVIGGALSAGCHMKNVRTSDAPHEKALPSPQFPTAGEAANMEWHHNNCECRGKEAYVTWHGMVWHGYFGGSSVALWL